MANDVNSELGDKGALSSRRVKQDADWPSVTTIMGAVHDETC